MLADIDVEMDPVVFGALMSRLNPADAVERKLLVRGLLPEARWKLSVYSSVKLKLGWNSNTAVGEVSGVVKANGVGR